MPHPEYAGRHAGADHPCMIPGGARIATFVALVAALGAFLAPPAAPAHLQAGAGLTALQSGVLHELNQIRLAHGLQPVRLNARLGAAADEHTREMAADGYFE